MLFLSDIVWPSISFETLLNATTNRETSQSLAESPETLDSTWDVIEYSRRDFADDDTPRIHGLIVRRTPVRRLIFQIIRNKPVTVLEVETPEW